jgi:hypothetical protein
VLAGESADGVTLDAVNRRGRSVRCKVNLSPLTGRDGEARGAIMFMEVENDSAG